MRFIMLAFLCAPFVRAADIEGDPWPRHVIDNTAQGADGARLADVNADGLPDISTPWEEGGLIRVYLHPGVRAVAQPWPPITVGQVGSPEDAVFADLDAGRCGRRRQLHRRQHQDGLGPLGAFQRRELHRQRRLAHRGHSRHGRQCPMDVLRAHANRRETRHRSSRRFQKSGRTNLLARGPGESPRPLRVAPSSDCPG